MSKKRDTMPPEVKRLADQLRATRAATRAALLADPSTPPWRLKLYEEPRPQADDMQHDIGTSVDWLRAALEQLAAANPLEAARLARVDAIMADAKQKGVPCDLGTEWRRAGTNRFDRPGYYLCLEPDGEVRWVPDTPDSERQRALGNTLRAQGMPDEAIETILWMDHELHVQQRKTDSVEDVEPVEPVKRTRQRKPTLAGVARQAAKAGIPVARYARHPDGTVSIEVGKPSETPDSTDSTEWD